MAAPESTTLQLSTRPAEGSRSARRLRRSGQVPGIVYGAGDEPVSVAVDARILRNTLARSGAVIEVSIDGGGAQPVLVKDVQRHPVRGEAMHVDLLRVRMDQVIHSEVVIELLGAESSPGVVQGGVLSQETLHLNVEALPGDLPDVIRHDVSGLELLGTVTLADVEAPAGVTFLDDPETTIASITPPSREEAPEDELETETEVVAGAKAEGETAGEAAQQGEAAES